MSFFSSCGSGLVPLQPKAASHEPITSRSYTSDCWYMSGSSLSFRVKEKLKSLNRVATGFTPLEVQPSFFFWRKDARRSPACHLPITQAQGITGNALYLPYCLRNSRERLMAGRRFRSHSLGFRKTILKPLTGFTPLEVRPSFFFWRKDARRSRFRSHSLGFRKTILKPLTGFTLIELLVVIAIIGILASIVLAALNSARQRSRDVRRLADINQLQKAIELYYDDAGSYPSALADIVPTYIAIEPHDPLDPTKSYNYCQLSSSSYHIAASLETSNDALNNDSDMITTCASGGQDIAGNDAAQCNSANDPAATSYCYDVVH